MNSFLAIETCFKPLETPILETSAQPYSKDIGCKSCITINTTRLLGQ